MFAYAPAESSSAGFALVTERFVGLFSADASTDVVSTVHRLLDGPGSTPEPALKLLEDPGVAERFAIVEIVDADNQIFEVTVRGDIVVDLGGASTSRFTWPRGTNWLRGEARGVESLQLGFDDSAPSSHSLPLRNGVVRASSVSLGIVAAEPRLEPRVEPAVPAQPATRPLASTEDSAPVRTPQAIDLQAMVAPPAWTLTLPDGNELEAAPQIVVGRRPWRSDPDETQTYYIVAPSPHKEISGKHVEFTVVGDELFARDLDSTNGTVIYTPDQAPRLLHGGSATNLVPGDALDLGDGFRIVVGTRR